MRTTAVWLLGSNVASQLLRLASNLILTRLLAPAAFGLMAAVSTIYFALSMFSDLGVWQSVVKSQQGAHKPFIGTAQSIEFLRGLVLAGLVVLTAGGLYVAAHYGAFKQDTVFADPQLAMMVAFVGLISILDGLVSMKLALAERSLKGDLVAKLELSAQLITAVATALIVWVSGSVWGLLWGWLISSFSRVLLSNFYLPGPFIRPCWEGIFASEIYQYGKWIFISSIIGFLADNGEKIIFARYLSATQFGIFSIATALLGAVAAIYSTLLGKVIFPGLSMAINDRLGIERLYARFQQMADVFVGLLAGGLLMSGQWVVRILYDPRYSEAGWMFQLLGLCMVGLRYQVVEQLMFASNRPDLVSANNLIRGVSLVVCIPIGFYLGAERGAILAVVLVQFSSWPLCIYFKWTQGLLVFRTEYMWVPAFAVGMGAGYCLDLILGVLIRLI